MVDDRPRFERDDRSACGVVEAHGHATEAIGAVALDRIEGGRRVGRSPRTIGAMAVTGVRRLLVKGRWESSTTRNCSSPASSPTTRWPSASPRLAQREGAEIVLTGFGRACGSPSGRPGNSTPSPRSSNSTSPNLDHVAAVRDTAARSAGAGSTEPCTPSASHPPSASATTSGPRVGRRVDCRPGVDLFAADAGRHRPPR